MLAFQNWYSKNNLMLNIEKTVYINFHSPGVERETDGLLVAKFFDLRVHEHRLSSQ